MEHRALVTRQLEQALLEDQVVAGATRAGLGLPKLVIADLTLDDDQLRFIEGGYEVKGANLPARVWAEDGKVVMSFRGRRVPLLAQSPTTFRFASRKVDYVNPGFLRPAVEVFHGRFARRTS